jgi:hypothetical protein
MRLVNMDKFTDKLSIKISKKFYIQIMLPPHQTIMPRLRNVNIRRYNLTPRFGKSFKSQYFIISSKYKNDVN